MRPPRRRFTATGLLASACAGLAALIYVELDDRPLSRVAPPSLASTGDAGAGAAATEGIAPPAEVAVDLPPLATFSEIEARPLFSPTRRPPPDAPEPDEPEAPAVESGRFLLRGVAIAGDDRVAVLERRDTGELLRVLEGQTVDGWRVVRIEPRRAVLAGGGDGGREEVIEIAKDSSDAAPVVQQTSQDRRRAAIELLRRRRLGREEAMQEAEPGEDAAPEDAEAAADADQPADPASQQ